MNLNVVLLGGTPQCGQNKHGKLWLLQLMSSLCMAWIIEHILIVKYTMEKSSLQSMKTSQSKNIRQFHWKSRYVFMLAYFLISWKRGWSWVHSPLFFGPHQDSSLKRFQVRLGRKLMYPLVMTNIAIENDHL